MRCSNATPPPPPQQRLRTTFLFIYLFFWLDPCGKRLRRLVKRIPHQCPPFGHLRHHAIPLIPSPFSWMMFTAFTTNNTPTRLRRLFLRDGTYPSARCSGTRPRLQENDTVRIMGFGGTRDQETRTARQDWIPGMRRCDVLPRKGRFKNIHLTSGNA
ncbi:hypothetical protein BT67DRAFT_110529 [Trichocladium antarcticum]|uniref:Uncharacterized protein n=1 Tax=Trichocladium antarcticum TaxID=1450529 RepID=A0AAN6UQQ4_9PEZI|nr:hypothetical protein BT67DRAFT_110529 [Trichocladium antarcticum]